MSRASPRESEARHVRGRQAPAGGGGLGGGMGVTHGLGGDLHSPCSEGTRGLEAAPRVMSERPQASLQGGGKTI